MALLQAACRDTTFTPPSPSILLPNATVTSITATPITNLTTIIPESALTFTPSILLSSTTFCNVTVRYTHPGQDDLVTVTTFLPIASPPWNERLLAVGGGGWSAGGNAGSFTQMLGLVGMGYATATTDAGLKGTDPLDARPWALRSEGDVNLFALRSFASVSLQEQAVAAKAVVRMFYGPFGLGGGREKGEPGFSYFAGCSQGGRQAMMLAQRYPTLYDGILAGAPAVNLLQFVAGTWWPRVFTEQALGGGAGIEPCELDEIARLVAESCDGLDGVVDGIVSDVDSCRATFNISGLVGKEFTCSTSLSIGGQKRMAISAGAVALADAVWSGPRGGDGRLLWYGPNIGSPLTDPLAEIGREAWGGQWLKLFVAKNSTFDLRGLTVEEYGRMFTAGAEEFRNLIETDDPDLSEFKRNGGKILSFHGLVSANSALTLQIYNKTSIRGFERVEMSHNSRCHDAPGWTNIANKWGRILFPITQLDHIIPTRSTEHYYKDVLNAILDVPSFYRYFEFPGLTHCYGGSGGQATSALAHLVAWVENGTAPDSLPVVFWDSKKRRTSRRMVCPYPQRVIYDGRGDATVATSFSCQ